MLGPRWSGEEHSVHRPREVVAPSGLMHVRVPTTPGVLELQSPDGALLGKVAIDPEAPVTRRSMLLRAGDVLGEPVKVVDAGPPSRKVDILFL